MVPHLPFFRPHVYGLHLFLPISAYFPPVVPHPYYKLCLFERISFLPDWLHVQGFRTKRGEVLYLLLQFFYMFHYILYLTFFSQGTEALRVMSGPDLYKELPGAIFPLLFLEVILPRLVRRSS